MLGIELLAKFNFDMALLAEKRAGCHHIDKDVEVGTDFLIRLKILYSVLENLFK